jgi:sulfur carrier protein
MVRINGNDVAAAEQNLQAFLEKEGYRCDRIAIELNGTIVPRRTYADVILHDGDSMEIVHFVGGG